MIEIYYNIIVHVLNLLSILFLPKYVDTACCFLHCSLLMGFALGLPSMSIRQQVKLNGENCEAWAGMGLGGWEGYGKWKFMYETKQQLSQIGFFEMSKHSQRFSRI